MIRCPRWVNTPQKEETYRYYFDDSYKPEKRDELRNEIKDKNAKWQCTLIKLEKVTKGALLSDYTLRDFFERKEM